MGKIKSYNSNFIRIVACSYRIGISGKIPSLIKRSVVSSKRKMYMYKNNLKSFTHSFSTLLFKRKLAVALSLVSFIKVTSVACHLSLIKYLLVFYLVIVNLFTLIKILPYYLSVN